MNTADTTIADEPAAAAPFCKALSIAATHRGRAAEARSGIPPVTGSFLDRCLAMSLEQRGCRHEEITAVCERHAARLQAAAGGAP